MNWCRRAALIATAILFGWLGSAGAAGAAPALWRVSDANSEIYLFGTLHALDPSVQWRTPVYDLAYARATTVWFEADLNGADPKTVLGIVGRYGVDRQRTLSEKLAPADLQALSRQVNVAAIDHLRPWAAALMLSMQPMLSKGARTEAGVDATVNRAAHRQTKTVRAFETLEDQARLFASLSEPAEVQYLTDVIHDRTRKPKLTLKPSAGSLEHAWLHGDMARLGAALIGQMQADNPALYEALLRRRNQAWADALSHEMDGAGVELVNVGALHMVGADGLPALLAARGYTLTRVQ